MSFIIGSDNIFGFLHRNKAQRTARKRQKLANRMQKTITRCVDARQHKLMSVKSYNTFMHVIAKRLGKVSSNDTRQQLNVLMRKIIDDPKHVKSKDAGQKIHDLILSISTKK